MPAFLCLATLYALYVLYTFVLCLSVFAFLRCILPACLQFLSTSHAYACWRGGGGEGGTQDGGGWWGTGGWGTCLCCLYAWVPACSVFLPPGLCCFLLPLSALPTCHYCSMPCSLFNVVVHWYVAIPTTCGCPCHARAFLRATFAFPSLPYHFTHRLRYLCCFYYHHYTMVQVVHYLFYCCVFGSSFFIFTAAPVVYGSRHPLRLLHGPAVYYLPARLATCAKLLPCRRACTFVLARYAVLPFIPFATRCLLYAYAPLPRFVCAPRTRSAHALRVRWFIL